jgi:SPP1 gp7 family putative phage head morphogenesis protein
MPSANRAIADALVSRAVKNLRYARKLAIEMVKGLNVSDAELDGFLRRQNKLARALRDAPIGNREVQAQLAELKQAVAEIRARGFDGARATFKSEVFEFAMSEAEATRSLIEKSVGRSLGMKDPSLYKVSERQINNVLAFGAIEGRRINDWWHKLQDDDLERIVGGVRRDLSQGKTLDEMTKTIIGDAKFGYKDGVINRTRRDAETLARTTAISVANSAREELYQANSDIIKNEQFFATLDDRTSPICQALDGKIFPLGKAPIPGAATHPNCRSVIVPVIAGFEDFIGDRPSVAGHNFKDEARKNYLGRRRAEGLSDAEAKDRWANLSNSRKNSLMNDARREFGEEAIGTASEKTTYSDWLRRRPASEQDEILGKTKAEAFRAGASIESFVDLGAMKPRTLAELRDSGVIALS